MPVCLFFHWQALASKDFGADKWVKQVAPIIDGKGGGKGEAAQATGSNTKALKEALDIATEFAKMNIS